MSAAAMLVVCLEFSGFFGLCGRTERIPQPSYEQCKAELQDVQRFPAVSFAYCEATDKPTESKLRGEK